MNSLTRHLFCCACVVLVLVVIADPAMTELPHPDQLEARVDALVDPYVRAGMFNGVVLVAERDTIHLLKGYGMASYELGVPNAPETRFRIASLSKQFTNAAIGTLIDQGKLNLDSRLSEFLPSFPRASEITIQQLIEHQSGIPHTNALDELKHTTRITLDEMIELLSSKPLDFDPGTNDRYSNGGYDVLAAVIENVSGKSYEAFLTEAVLVPLSLQNTGVLHAYEIVSGMATGYLPGEAPGTRGGARFYPASIRIGGGALYANATDVYHLFRATFQRTFAARNAGEVLFWDNTKRYEITGRSPGFVAKVFLDGPRDITVVTLANNYSAIVKWAQRIYQAAIDDPWEFESISQTVSPIKTDPRFLGFYEGRWDNGLVSQSQNGDVLWFDEVNDWRVALVPLSPRRYLHPFFDTICEVQGENADSLVCHPVLKRIDEQSVFRKAD